MAKIERFEDIIAWKSSMELCSSVYAITQNETFSKDLALKDQMRRSSISIPSNIAEGFEMGSNKQFMRYLFIAKASCGELRTQLNIAKNVDYINEQKFEGLNQQSIEISRMISKLISYLKNIKPLK
jgi:four helix bundle protein